MNCPECHQVIPEDGICKECGIFFVKPVYEIHDLRNYNVQQKRDYKKLDHFKEVLNQFQGKEMREIPGDVIQSVREKIPDNLEPVSYTHLTLPTKA